LIEGTTNTLKVLSGKLTAGKSGKYNNIIENSLSTGD